MIDMVELEIPHQEVIRLMGDERFNVEKVEYHKNGAIRKTIKSFNCYKMSYIHPIGSFIGVLYLKVSLHKLFNFTNFGNDQNYDRFTHSKLSESIEILESNLNLDSEILYIRNIEFGLNLPISKSPKEFIEKNIISYKYKTPNNQNNFAGGGFISRYYLREYELKIYDKSLQYNLDQNILRMEMKTHRMSKIRKAGIATLSDLVNKTALMNLKEIYLKHFNQLLIVDSLNFENIPFQDGCYIGKYIYPKTIGVLDYKVRNRIKVKLDKLLNKHGYFSEKGLLMEQLIKVWDDLLNDFEDQIEPKVMLPRNMAHIPT